MSTTTRFSNVDIQYSIQPLLRGRLQVPLKRCGAVHKGPFLRLTARIVACVLGVVTRDTLL